MDDLVGNISLEIGIIKRNEIDILELKVTIAEVQKNHYKDLTGDLNRKQSVNVKIGL